MVLAPWERLESVSTSSGSSLVTQFQQLGDNLWGRGNSSTYNLLLGTKYPFSAFPDPTVAYTGQLRLMFISFGFNGMAAVQFFCLEAGYGHLAFCEVLRACNTGHFADRPPGLKVFEIILPGIIAARCVRIRRIAHLTKLRTSHCVSRSASQDHSAIRCIAGTSAFLVNGDVPSNYAKFIVVTSIRVGDHDGYLNFGAELGPCYPTDVCKMPKPLCRAYASVWDTPAWCQSHPWI